ncbi:MAG: bifunctional 4-hydroxy-2-oxoglutarate aldolase/2-dehydro-3-deoxy-phosphogluconate aldolase [Planctomycetota bacterium]
MTHACARAGVRTFEFTNRGDGAAEVFASILPRLRDAAPSLILGVGSIGDPYTAGLYLASGANFVVGPSLNPEVAKLCNRRKVAYAPGCGSATEVATAEELGCEIVKVFPGNSVGGPDFVKSVLGPCPWTSMMPTGGVEPTRESLEKWFGAGIVAAGIGSKLMPKDAVATGDWSTVESTVRGTLETIASIRAAT